MQRRDWKSLIMWIMLSKSLRDSLKRIMVTSLSLGKETRSSAKSHSSSTPLTWYVLMEMGYDSPDLPIGMVAQLHLKRCEKALLEFIEKVKSLKEN